MKFSFRSLNYRWHRLIKTKKFRINGVYISTSLEDISPSVQKDLFRGTYEDTERKFIEQFIKPDNRVLEIGCGIGLVSLVASKICTGKNIKSYEANPHMERVIKKNYALNGMVPNLEMKAVSSSGENLEFYIDPDIISSSVFDRQKSSKKQIIKSEALDDILKSFNPDTIVMDVEGAEVELLTNSSLAGVDQMIVEVHPQIVGKEKVIHLNDSLAAMEFKMTVQKGKVCVYHR